MNRYDFGSSVKREVAPASGQRWKFNLPEEDVAAIASKINDAIKRKNYLKVVEVDRSRGYLIVGTEGEDFLVTRRNLSQLSHPDPKLRSRVFPFKREWLKNFEFVGFEDLYGVTA